MRYVNQTSFTAAHIPGRLNFPGHSLTFVVKGTFDLHQGKPAEPADYQPYPTGDEFYPDDGDMTGGPRYEYDYAFFKPKADLLLVGHCHPAGGKPVPACRITFRVGPYSRSLYVFGNRFWKGLPGLRVISDPEPFKTMELRYDNSFGGAGDARNPVGKGYGERENAGGKSEWQLPNIEDPEHLIDSPDSRPEPAGYGPLGRMWKYRASMMGTYTKDWKNERWPWFPADFTMSHFNAAHPRMQAAGYLRGDEPLFFENLHPKHSRYESRLPGVRMRCFVNCLDDPETGRMRFTEVPLVLDTLWADMDREKLTLVWRGNTAIRSEEFGEVRHAYFISERLDDAPASLEHCHTAFIKALATEEEGFALETEQEEVRTAEPVIAAEAAAAAPGMAAAEVPEEEAPTRQAPVIDPEAIKSQVKSIITQTGFNIDSLSPGIRDRINQEMDKVIDRMAERDTAKVLEEQQASLHASLSAALAKSGLDTDNLPPMSGKARQEQIRMLNELGLDNAEAVLDDPDFSKIFTTLVALYPKLGLDPENISPMIERTKEHLQRMSDGLSSGAGKDRSSGGETGLK